MDTDGHGPTETPAAYLERLDGALAASLADVELSLGERQELRALFASMPGLTDAVEVRRRAFAAAAAALADVERGPRVVAWLLEVVQLLDGQVAATTPARPSGVAEAHFSPGHDCRTRIAQLLNTTRQHVDICVFTITDDRIADAILAAHDRGVAVRIVTDDEKAEDAGSDIHRLRRAGVPVRIDRTPAHMHHKFAIFDGGLLLTGSYNWTRGAAEQNEENFVITSDERHVAPFRRVFEKLWNRLDRHGHR